MDAIILARGKKSKRLNLNKAFIKVGSKKIIEIILEKINPIFENVYIVSLKPEKFEVYQTRKIKILKDEIKCGPLGGIYIGLLNSNSRYNFVFAVDMPFINVDFVKYVMKIKKNYDVLVPVYNGKIQVLHAIYSKKIIPVIQETLNEGEYEVKTILYRVKVKYIQETEIEKFGDPQILFFNLNTYKDYEFIQKYLKIS
ncbi:MAG: molybdenum cofactor guanylyltransferase [Candidatus Omnitrophica bacterium]|nr:molybdenum cofactor guanylyltransferase [Candidatus Omnitrophota bacterium]MCM8807310.1 molybdenum cofactor guanylyltransferase [Candidatus Omnitrophota bacterium]